MMKVLHFGRFYNDNFGGIERHVELLLKGLSRHMHIDNLVANETFSYKKLEVDGYRVYKAPSMGIVASTALCPTMPLMARNLHKHENYDIVHLHFPDPMSHLTALTLPRNVKLVITWHSDIIRQQKALKLYRPFLDKIVQRADAIFAATPAHFTSSTQLSAVENPAKLHVVPYGIDTSPFEADSAIREGKSIRDRYPGRQIVFSVGRHVYYKGLEYLIRAMKNISPSAILLLGGTGPLTADLKNLAERENVSDRVKFLGRIPDDQLPSFYHAADIFCMPSIEPSEAFGLVQVEAMMCEKPVICCELNNGVTYINKHNETGLVIPARNSEALASALNQLLMNPEQTKKMGKDAKSRALGEFTLENMWEKTILIYESLL